MLEPEVDYGTFMRSRRLQHRLDIRPYDISAIEELVDIAYAERNEDACILAIERSFKLDLGTPSRLYLMYGKCFFRRWRKSGDIQDIKSAVAAYQKAVRFSEHQRSAILYFELVAMQLRAGKHQTALNLLGVIMTLFRDVNDTERENVYWLEIAQYLTGTILFASGNMRDSYRIYKDLLLHRVEVPDIIHLIGVDDHVCWLPMRIQPIFLSLETARLRHRQGDEHLACGLFRDFWKRLDHLRELQENTVINSTAREDSRFKQKGSGKGLMTETKLEEAEVMVEEESNLNALRSIMRAKAPAADSKLARQASRLTALNRQASRLEAGVERLSRQGSNIEPLSRQSSNLDSRQQSHLSPLMSHQSFNHASVRSMDSTPTRLPSSSQQTGSDEGKDGEEEVSDPFALSQKEAEADPHCLYLLFGTYTFDEWIHDHRVFKKIGDIYRKWYNNPIMAAEFYAMASEIIAGNCTVGEKRIGFNDAVRDYHDAPSRSNSRLSSNNGMDMSRPTTADSTVANTTRAMSTNGLITTRSGARRTRWEDLPQKEMELAVYYLLDRAEALVEVGLTKQAEECAHFCYSLLPFDVIVLGRASRCVPLHRRHVGVNKTIIEASDRLFRRVHLVVNRLKAMVKERRRLNKLLLHKHGTRINSFIRMILVRNRTAGDRLSNISIRNIWPLIKSLRHVVFRTGTQQILDWLEIWNQSSVRIMCCFRRWYQRRLNARFYRGLRVLQKILLGQTLRLRMRRLVERIEEEQEAAANVAVHHGNCGDGGADSDDVELDLLTKIRKKRKIRKVGYQCEEVVRLQRAKLIPSIYARATKQYYCPTMFIRDSVRTINSATFTALDTAEVMCMEVMHELDMPLSTSLFDATGIALTRDRKAPSLEMPHYAPGNCSQIFGLTSPEHGTVQQSNYNRTMQPSNSVPALQRSGQNIFSSASFTAFVPMDTVNQSTSIKSSRGSERSYSGTSTGIGSKTLLQSRAFEISPALEDAYVSHAVGSRYYSRDNNPGRKFIKPKTLLMRSQTAMTPNVSVSFASDVMTDALDESMSTLGIRGTDSGMLFTGPGVGSRVLPVPSSAFACPDDEISATTQPAVQAFNKEIVGKHCISLVALNSKGSQTNKAGYHAGKLGDRSGTEQWVPFGILPDKHIYKLLESTVFVVTSPSFSVTDAKRISRLVRDNRENHVRAHKAQKIGAFTRSMSMRFGIVLPSSEHESVSTAASVQASPFASPFASRPTTPHRNAPPVSRTAEIIKPYSTLVWSGIKSLSIYGTSMLYVGLRALFDLGIQHLDSLTVSNTGGAFSHKLGTYLGERLLAQFDYKKIDVLRENHYRGLLENFQYDGGVVQKVVVGTEFNDNMYVQSVSRLDQFMAEEERKLKLGAILPARTGEGANGTNLGLVSGQMILSTRTNSPLNAWMNSVQYGSTTKLAPTSPSKRYNNKRPCEPRPALPIDELTTDSGVIVEDRLSKKTPGGSKLSTPVFSRTGSEKGQQMHATASQRDIEVPIEEGEEDEENSVQVSCDAFDGSSPIVAKTDLFKPSRGPMLGKLKGVLGNQSFSKIHYVKDGLDPGEFDREVNETNADGDFVLGEDDVSEYANSQVSDMQRTVQAQLRMFEREKMHIPELMNVAVLRKLSIEGEVKFGDRGTIQLFSLLQFNESLQHITIKGCKLTQRSAGIICRFLSLSSTIQTMNLNDNKLCHHSITMFLHACANKGATSRLKDVYLQDQQPGITEKEALSLLTLGTKLCVRVDASKIVDITQETAHEMEQEGPDIDDMNSISIRSAFEDLSRSNNMHMASVVNMNAKRIYL